MLNQSKKILKQYWGFESFRNPQDKIIESILKKEDVIALLPTGGGKSICFQIPALQMDGVCLVITPLVALMDDQVKNLKSKGIKAFAIHSGKTKKEIDIILNNCIYGGVKLLYLSPERLKTELFIERFKAMKVSFLAIDEAHCISQWGFDFRPSFLEIAKLKEFKPELKFAAFTATATEKVLSDISSVLEIENCKIHRKSFYRENLHYYVLEKENKWETLLQIVRKKDGAGIVYVRSRRQTVEFAQYLSKQGYTALAYHAGLDHEERKKRQNLWMTEKSRIMVATSAFGMGIDKSNVKFVINIDIPESIEAFFQEAGRGGRDGNVALSILLYNQKDVETAKIKTKSKFPELDIIKKVYHHTCSNLNIAIGAGLLETYTLPIDSLRRLTGLKLNTIYSAIGFIEKSGYWTLTESSQRFSRLKFITDQKALYHIQLKYPKLDALIKTLLRSYGHVFDVYVSVKEKDLANRMKMNLNEVSIGLNQLHDMNVIDFQEKTDDALITLLQPRQDIKNIRIDQRFYAEQRKRTHHRLECMLGYLSNEVKCRSTYLLNYFDETDAEKCGTCDLCRADYETNEIITGTEIEIIRKKIIQLNENIELNFKIVKENLIAEHSEENIKTALKWLLDNNIIRTDALNNIKQID